jgi:hypothetical protein
MGYAQNGAEKASACFEPGESLFTFIVCGDWSSRPARRHGFAQVDGCA